jgi:acyl-coenzyme A synthetase/AMP-(fatty) acid ligase/pimeloyl-ACP methyl ester carboxylesterase
VIPLSIEEPATRLVSIIDRVGECSIANTSSVDLRSLGTHDVMDLVHVRSQWVDPLPSIGDSPSLVVFTSGSTGVPKGVIRTGWQDDVAVLRVRNDYPDQFRSAIFAPLNWVGGLNVLRSRLSDGYLLIVDPRSSFPHDLVELLRHEQIEALHLTPSLAESLNQSLGGAVGVESVNRVRYLGEEIRWSAIRAARALGGRDTLVLATYAASESLGTIGRSEIAADEMLGDGRVPIRELAGDFVQLETIDESQPELFEISVHRWVSRGYWGDPFNTQRVFGLDTNGDPVYRSGDLFERNTHGELVFAGRRDDVIKIAGKLVNPSETTAALMAFPGVRQAVVLPRALPSGRKQLTAHLEVSPDVDPDGVRRRLADQLPAHLIPAVLVRHDQLPLANGGKVDRQRLLGEPLVQWRTSPRVEPRNDLERFVLIEVTRMLGLPDLGVDDDLWTFGLDSLGAIELSETLSRAMASNLSVNDFIGASTVGAISKRIAESRPSKPSNVVTLVESESKPTVFIMTGAGGPALQYRAVAQGLTTGAGVVGLEQWGLMQNCRPDRSVTAAAKRNVQTVIDVAGSGSLVLIGHSWGGLVAHEMAIRLSDLGRTVYLVLLDTGRQRSGKRNHKLPLVLRALGQSSPQKIESLHRSRLYWIVRPRLSWVLRDDKFRQFFWIGVRSAKRHRAGVFTGRVLLIQAEGSSVGLHWRDQPQLQVERTHGNHVSMCHAPHVQGLVDIVNTFVTSCLADGSIARG